MSSSPTTALIAPPDFATIEQESGIQTKEAIRRIWQLVGTHSFPLPWSAINSSKATPWDRNWQTTWSNSGGTQPSIGNGSLGSGYFRIGSTVFFYIAINWGSTTSGGDAAGTWAFSTPSTIATNGLIHGYAIQDSVAGTKRGFSVGLSTGGAAITMWPDNGATWSNTSPITWASADKIRIFGWYAE